MSRTTYLPVLASLALAWARSDSRLGAFPCLYECASVRKREPQFQPAIRSFHHTSNRACPHRQNIMNVSTLPSKHGRYVVECLPNLPPTVQSRRTRISSVKYVTFNTLSLFVIRRNLPTLVRINDFLARVVTWFWWSLKAAAVPVTCLREVPFSPLSITLPRSLQNTLNMFSLSSLLPGLSHQFQDDEPFTLYHSGVNKAVPPRGHGGSLHAC
jgi:hypothetical protein